MTAILLLFLVLSAVAGTGQAQQATPAATPTPLPPWDYYHVKPTPYSKSTPTPVSTATPTPINEPIQYLPGTAWKDCDALQSRVGNGRNTTMEMNLVFLAAGDCFMQQQNWRSAIENYEGIENENGLWFATFLTFGIFDAGTAGMLDAKYGNVGFTALAYVHRAIAYANLGNTSESRLAAQHAIYALTHGDHGMEYYQAQMPEIFAALKDLDPKDAVELDPQWARNQYAQQYRAWPDKYRVAKANGEPCHVENFDKSDYHQETWWYCDSEGHYEKAFTFVNDKLESTYTP